MPQSACFIEGRPVSLVEAIATAARLIYASRMPLFGGLVCDVAAARAAIALAERVGGVIDHRDSDVAFRDLDVLRSVGKFMTTPSEVRQRADTILVVGSGLTRLWPEMSVSLGLAEIPRLSIAPAKRQILWLGAQGNEPSLSGLADCTIRVQDESLPALTAALRARNGRRPLALKAAEIEGLDAMVARLQRAHFGVALWSPSNLDALAIEMLSGLIADLNKTTRFSSLSLGVEGSAEMVMQTSAWMTGFPVRTGFARGYPEHDPWRFDAARLLESGEADTLIWISCGATDDLPAAASNVPRIVLNAGGPTQRGAHVYIPVGRPGVDHDGIEFMRETQSLAVRRATRPSDAPSIAHVLGTIAASLPGGDTRC
ncbi:MAG: tungsten-containing formylmethanofuran dehydrogenase subunit B [Beijerinckiaceae bacterium]